MRVNVQFPIRVVTGAGNAITTGRTLNEIAVVDGAFNRLAITLTSQT